MSTATSSKKRPVPHIHMTPELEEAIAAVSAAVPDVLPCNPGDPSEVRAALGRLARSFEDPAFFYTDEAASEAKAVERLILLAQLHLAHLNAGNLP